MEQLSTSSENPYPFFWLDYLLEHTLNPLRNNLSRISPEMLQNVEQRIPTEITRITGILKSQAFSIYQVDHLKLLTNNYDHAIRLLRKQAAANLECYPVDSLLRQTGESISASLIELSQYLYNRYQSYLPDDLQTENQSTLSREKLGKILCNLSADQIGLLLRAAYDSGILIGRSFSKICQTFAPFISTQWKNEIKSDTLRSHATRPESRDKEITIAFLEKMIDKIIHYH